MQSEKAVGAHDISSSHYSAGLKCTHARPTQREREDIRLLHLTHVGAPKLLLWKEIYMSAAREPQWSVNAIISLRVTATRQRPPLVFFAFFLFLPSFLSRYIYVAISSGSSIGLPRMSELSKEKQTVYLRRRLSLMHNGGVVCPSTRLSQKKRKLSTIRIPTYIARTARATMSFLGLSSTPASIASQTGQNGKFRSVEKSIYLSI